MAGKHTLRLELREVRRYPCASEMILDIGHSPLLPDVSSDQEALVTYACLYNPHIGNMTAERARDWDDGIRAGQNNFMAWRSVQVPLATSTSPAGKAGRTPEEKRVDEQALYRQLKPVNDFHESMHKQIWRQFARATLIKDKKEFTGELAKIWISTGRLLLIEHRRVFLADWQAVAEHELNRRRSKH